MEDRDFLVDDVDTAQGTIKTSMDTQKCCGPVQQYPLWEAKKPYPSTMTHSLWHKHITRMPILQIWTS